MGVVGLLDSDSVMAGLAALGVLGLAALKRSGKFSSIYLASMAIGVVGLILVAYLPGAWTIAGVPFLGFAAIATRGLEQRGWDRA
jgi:presenilin-like A22 family membrane protease